MNCFDSNHWLCSECQRRIGSTATPALSSATMMFSLATWLFFAAFAIIFIGVLLMTLGSLSNLNPNNSSGGAIILIGPIPIIFGAGQNSLAIVALAVLLTIFSLIFFLLLRKKSWQRS